MFRLQHHLSLKRQPQTTRESKIKPRRLKRSRIRLYPCSIHLDPIQSSHTLTALQALQVDGRASAAVVRHHHQSLSPTILGTRPIYPALSRSLLSIPKPNCWTGKTGAMQVESLAVRCSPDSGPLVRGGVRCWADKRSQDCIGICKCMPNALLKLCTFGRLWLAGAALEQRTRYYFPLAGKRDFAYHSVRILADL